MAIYIKFDSIDGSITAKGHEKWSEVTSYNFSSSLPVAMKTGSSQNRQTGIPRMSKLEIVKPVDISSPYLFKKLCEAASIPKVQIHVCHAGDELQVSTEYTLSDVLVSGYEDNGIINAQGTGEEYVQLHFIKIEKKHTPYDSKNSAGSSVVVGYDLAEAHAI